MTHENTTDVKEALNEYFRLKQQLAIENKLIKRKILNNTTLSKREKRAEFLKLKPSCVNCKRRSKLGSVFSIVFHPADDKTSAYRIFKCSCGDLANPCNLNIEIHLDEVEPVDKVMNDIRNDINEVKNEIINDKNKLLFGLITTESAIENFESNKTFITGLTSLYESYLDKWNNLIDNEEKKIELEESLVQSYSYINQIKDCIKMMNEKGDTQYAIDAANIYHKTLEPLLKKIRQLKYSQNYVYNDDNQNVCKLIQKKYGITDLLTTGITSRVVAYDVGFKPKTLASKKKGLFVVESDEEGEEEKRGVEEGKISIQIKPSEQQKKILEDEPIIGKGEDGIEWNEPEYKELWSRLPPKLKNAFKLNIDWMKEFMVKCVNERMNKPPGWNGCILTTPPNIIIPPRKMENGQYDFGVSLYNEAFNKLPPSLQSTYLTFYKEDSTTKEKNYSMLENAMNELVQKEVGFGRGFF
jgi:hypothetical protein